MYNEMINKTHLKYNPSIGGNSPQAVVLTKAHQWNGFAFIMENTNEIWAKIDGYSRYEISNLGNVKSFKNYPVGLVLRCNKMKNGYVEIVLSHNDIKRRVRVHRLVCEAFIPNPENKPFVNHLNGIKNDNSVGNLEWCTQSENNSHAYRTGLKVNPMKGKYGAMNPRSKPVVKMDLDGNVIQEYVSLEDTGEKALYRVRLCCQKQRASYNGFKWAWATKEEKF